MFQILFWYPWKGKKVYVPLRTAYSQAGRCGMQPKPSSLRAQAQLSETRTETVETFELVKVEPKLLREKKGERERRLLVHKKPMHVKSVEAECPPVLVCRVVGSSPNTTKNPCRRLMNVESFVDQSPHVRDVKFGEWGYVLRTLPRLKYIKSVFITLPVDSKRENDLF
ncbi:hypothetical protein TNCV_2771731 [Trichonephila clavipes]|nr:hypothetical protein TNCV_2771731 [Trichonephila clavipes]